MAANGDGGNTAICGLRFYQHLLRDGILTSSPMWYASGYMEICVRVECCPEESYVYPYSNVERLQYEYARLHVMS